MNQYLLQQSPIVVKILGEAHGYWNPGFKTTCKGLVCKIQGDFNVHETNTLVIEGNEDKVITVHNFRDNKPLVGGYYLAFAVGNVYALDSQASFSDWEQ